MDHCRVCGRLLDEQARFELSDWCHTCVTMTIAEQQAEDTPRIKPEVFRV